MKTAKLFIGIALSLYIFLIQGFKDSVNSNSSAKKVSSIKVPSPKNVKASDGTYTDQITITWEGSSPDLLYSVYEIGKDKDTIRLNDQWLVNCIHCSFTDGRRTLKPGRRYRYAIRAAMNSIEVSAYSEIDSGYLKSFAEPLKDSIKLKKDTVGNKK